MHQQRLKVEKPYNFNLIPQFFFKESKRFTPYSYRIDNWSCLIAVNGKQIPVIIHPKRIGNSEFLDVLIHDEASSRESEMISKIIENSFNANLNLQDFYKLALTDKKLQTVIRDLTGLKPYYALDPYHSLIRTIIRQLISAQMALGVMSNLVTTLGEVYEIENEKIYGMPSAEKLAKATKNQLLKCKVGYKWKLIKKIARDIVAGDLDLRYLEKKNDEYVIERLTEYSGIGDWTARTFLFDGFHRLDSYPIYDISVVKAISNLYYHSSPISNKEVDKFFVKYRNYRGIAITYLFGSNFSENFIISLESSLE